MVRNGHSWNAIQTYTLPQIKLFTTTALKLEGYSRASNVEDMRTGMWAEGTDYSEYLTGLRGGRKRGKSQNRSNTDG